LLGFVLIVYLGLSGGGFDLLVTGQVGIVIWWILLLGFALGVLPRRRPGPAALGVLALLAAFVAWTALSLTWSESFEKTAIDLARMATVLGVFALAIVSRDRGGSTHMVNALAAGIFVISAVALLSWLHPSWFPDAAETGRFLETGKERLSYPLDYWNGLAALIGIGLPLMLVVACRAGSIAVRALAAAATPVMMLALLFTLSRGGIGATLIGIALLLLFTNDRITQVLTMLVTGIGGGTLVVIGLKSHDLAHGMQTSTAHAQGNRLLWITIGVCIVVGLVQAGLSRAARNRQRPTWSVVSRRNRIYALGTAVLIVIVALFAINAPSKLSNAWDDFKQPSNHSEQGTGRLTSAGGENRYQFWSSAAREFESKPLTGTGSGTFQLWWTRDGEFAAPIVDTHNLYMQTLGELGIVGLALLVAFIVAGLWLGAVRVLRAGASKRPYLAAAVAGSTVLWTTSIFDWMWKIPIIPIATVLLIAIVLTAGDPEAERRSRLAPLARIAVAVLSLVVIVAIAIPLASESLVRGSQSKSREGDTSAALSEARSAANVEPEAAAPRLQQALLLETQGDFAAAQAEAKAATERESTNWRNWLVLSRIEAQRGQVQAALAAYRKARSLNPTSPIFSEAESGG
jgi:hypothetical protein